MRNQISSICFILFSMLFHQHANAQCGSGEVAVTIDVLTDQYAYELYWELTPSGNDCGSGTIVSGGNTNVGCNGGGDKNQNENSEYSANSTYTISDVCLTEGETYTIHAIDDYADGGNQFNIKIGGDFTLFEFKATGGTEEFNFEASPPPALDANLVDIVTPAYVYKESQNIRATLRNTGTTVITSVELSYSIDGGTAVTAAIEDLELGPFTNKEIEHPTAWMPTDNGTVTIDVEVLKVNGESNDANSSNNAVEKSVVVKAAIPRILGSYYKANAQLNHIEIAGSDEDIEDPQDLDFHPDTKELWVINKETQQSGGTTVTIFNPGEDDQTEDFRKDGNAWHFMNQPSGIAFSDNENFATSHAVYDANHSGGQSQPFSGPTLWSSDPNIYAKDAGPGTNGSHLDMLHASPYSMGITHIKDNAFYVFDGNSSDIVMYDFKEDHGPGMHDHSDGEVLRYSDISVKMHTDKVPSHLSYDKKTEWLYIVDGGNARILRVNTADGTVGGTPSFGPFEPLAVYKNKTGSTQEVLVTEGLTKPCGIDVLDNTMIVSDHSTGKIHIYDISDAANVVELSVITTESAGITGVVIGPNGRIWYSNETTDKIFKIEPSEIITDDEANDLAELNAVNAINIYPNPATDFIQVSHTDYESIEIVNLEGKQVFYTNQAMNQISIEDLNPGLYLANISTERNIKRIQLIKQ